MDQLKEFLRQAVKYRFWIAIGIASLLPLIAFFVGTGAMAEQEKAETAKIKAANSDASNYTSAPIKNGQWKNAVTEKTAILAEDVNRSHRKLYDAQAPLLTWPDEVKAYFEEWGPKYPEGLDLAKIDDILLTYTQVYPNYVDKVYEKLNAFDPETGKGIVAAPSIPALLLPEVFKEETRPTLNEVWTAQRRLWIQATMLDIIAKVNAKAKAKDWDSAPIKQLVWMDIATETALDQRTGTDKLTAPPEIPGPGQAPARKDDTAKTADAKADPAKIQFVTSPNPEQYYIVPVAMRVYMEQSKLADFLVEFRNSPMSIVVKDFEWCVPAKPIIKPKKGQSAETFDGMAAGGGRNRGGLAGEQMMGGMGDLEGAGGGQMSVYDPNGAGSAYNKNNRGSRGMGNAGVGNNTKGQGGREGGTNVAADSLKKMIEKRATKKNAGKDEKGKVDEEEVSPGTNPYYNVVQVTIRGQARFYVPPPKPPVDPKGADAKSEPAKDEPKDAAKPADAKADPAKPADAKDDTAKPADAKADAAKPADAKAEPVKDDPAKPADAKPADPKADPAKAEPVKDDPAKPADPKAEPARGEAAKPADPKAEPAKDAPKGDAPKDDPSKPKDAGSKP